MKVPDINSRKRIPQEAISSVVKQIIDRFHPAKIILFGSYANDTPTPESDVDLLVVMNSSLRNVEQAQRIARAIDFHFGLDILVRSQQQIDERLSLGDYFLMEIMEKGKVLYERIGERVD